MTEDNGVTRREFEDLKEHLRRMSADAVTVAVLSAQIATLNRDVTDLKRDTDRSIKDMVDKFEVHNKSVDDKFGVHSKEHEKDNEARTIGRRWMITTAVAMLAVLAGLYGFIALIIHG